MRGRGEDYRDYGVTLRHWRRDLKLFAALCAIGAPLYLGGYLGFAYLLEQLPPHWAHILSPYPAQWHFQLRLPPRFDEYVVDQVFVVALPEEFFYRGFMQ